MRFLFVVHGYPPDPGGSQYYVQWMAEECLRRGHEVAVLAGVHGGDLNGVGLTGDPRALEEGWDLIVVHGGDVPMQNLALARAGSLRSPMLLLIIKPSESRIYRYAMETCALLGCSTPEDWAVVRRHGAGDRAVQVRHGIPRDARVGTPGVFREKFGIPRDTRMFLSCGGYWPNKRMRELAAVFEQAALVDAMLVTTGYADPVGQMPAASDRVLPLLLDDPADVADAMADADAYIMNSDSEGFGLTLLECMANRTPWIAREIAGARVLREFGTTYASETELPVILAGFRRDDGQVERAHRHLLEERLIEHSVDDILAAVGHVRRLDPLP